MLEEKDFLRYSRQIELEGFGVKGQEKLKQARVLIVGVGGLGSIASLLLVGAGIGKIGLMDKDSVSLSNLHRQLIYREEQIGKPKVEMAKKNLSSLNSNCDIVAYDEYLTEENAEKIISEYDIVVDCCDNFKTRYVINDACLRLGKPFVYSSIEALRGQVAFFELSTGKANYRTLYPNESELKQEENSSKAVIATLPLLVATLATNEVIRFLVNGKSELKDRLLCVDLTNLSFQIFNLE